MMPVPGAALTTNSTRPKKKLKFVCIVGASNRLLNVSSAPDVPRVTLVASAKAHSAGISLMEVKSTVYELVASPLSFGQTTNVVSIDLSSGLVTYRSEGCNPS